MGSYVPAHKARIGVADRIMSRIGTADDLAQDLSTFMVEMIETANILTYATKKSLVIMDEVGRGTATADGISLAYAILSYLHTHIKSRLLFATHYHELADMVKQKQELATIQLYKTDLAEDQMGRFVFLHKIQPGVCRKSHGLKVAQLAGNQTSSMMIMIFILHMSLDKYLTAVLLIESIYVYETLSKQDKKN